MLIFLLVPLLVLCWLWHQEKCRACDRQTCRDISAETAATQELIRILERRRARRAPHPKRRKS
jgi:hypothetical protein